MKTEADQDGQTIERPEQWCILRTAPRSTLSLARSLGEDGYTAWTPTQVAMRMKSRRKAAEERPSPILPSFVFADADHLPRLALLRTRLTTMHVGFSIFRYAGRIPLIADGSLEQLRKQERRAAERHEVAKRRSLAAPAFQAGQRVRVDNAAWTGLEGVVKQQHGEYVLVCFGGSIMIKISAWLLNPNDISIAQPIMGAAA
jgi:hypothetical protein